MAEKSSAGMAFRASVMLVCLVLVAVAAFCGNSFPAVVKAIQSGRWPTAADFHNSPGSAPSQTTEAPRFLPPAVSPAQVTDARTMGFSGQPATSGFPPQAETPHPAVTSASYNAPIPPDSRADAGQPKGFVQDKGLGADPARRLTPLPSTADNLVPLDRPAATGHADAPAGGNRPLGGISPDKQFEYIHTRLRQLGATYFILETCGEEKREFRFYCKMSIGGNPRVTKPFWCFHADPLIAMTQVLKQVEDWQGAGG